MATSDAELRETARVIGEALATGRKRGEWAEASRLLSESRRRYRDPGDAARLKAMILEIGGADANVGA